jgi:hypothetical protein
MKSYLKIIIILVCFFCIHFFSQTQERFNKLYDLTPNTNSKSYGLVNVPAGYIIGGISLDIINGFGFYKFKLIGVDFQGEKVWEKQYGTQETSYSSVVSYVNHLNRFNDVNYAICTVYDVLINNYFSKMFAFNDVGDTLWTKVFEDNLSFYYNTMNSTNDGGIILSGYMLNGTGGLQKQLLTKIDLNGNILWTNSHNDIQNYKPKGILQDINTNQFLVVGSEYDFDIQNNKPFIKKLNNAGDLQSSFPLNFEFGGEMNNIKQLNDGNFIACGTKYSDPNISVWPLKKGVVLKFDINGNILWSKTYGEHCVLNDFSDIVILDNDEIVVAGSVDTIFNYLLVNFSNFQLYKLSANGDSLWSRMIDIYPGFYGEDFFKQIVKTNDQGFAMTGYYINDYPTKFVLVKTDEYGCVVENCQTASLENEQGDTSKNLVFPNPTDENIYINNEHFEINNFELLDLSGQIILIGNTQFEKEIVIPVSNLANASYFLKLYKENKIVKNELIIVNH